MKENIKGPVNSPHKCPVTRKMLPFDDFIMYNMHSIWFTLLKRFGCSSAACVMSIRIGLCVAQLPIIWPVPNRTWYQWIIYHDYRSIAIYRVRGPSKDSFDDWEICGRAQMWLRFSGWKLTEGNIRGWFYTSIYISYKCAWHMNRQEENMITTIPLCLILDNQTRGACAI